MNAHQTIYVVSPEHTSGSQLLFRENTAPMITNKHVLILAASVTTGYTAQAAVEAVDYYGGMVAGITSIFATVTECAGYPVTSDVYKRQMTPSSPVKPTRRTKAPAMCCVPGLSCFRDGAGPSSPMWGRTATPTAWPRKPVPAMRLSLIHI